MEFLKLLTLKEVADFLKCSFVGNPDFPIEGMNEIHKVKKGDLVFVDHPKYYEKALQSKASVILINQKVDCPQGKALLISDDPFSDFNKLTSKYRKEPSVTTQLIDSTAVIDSTAIIRPNVFVGKNVKIGSFCVIHPNVVIYDDAIIGDRVIIHAGTVIGADAFYYKKRESGYDRLLSSGNVEIENDVEIGALCTIDRGVTATTLIKTGTKIDNQVHIGHDSVLGRHCVIASQVGIAGCVTLEDGVTFWGQVGMTSNATVGENATVLAQSGISKSLEGHKTYFGYPAEESRLKLKEMAALKRIIRDK